MRASYVPLVKTLKAEFDALGHVSRQSADGILPLFDLDVIKKDNQGSSGFSEVGNVTEKFIDKKARLIDDFWHGREAMIDAYHWFPADSVESGEHVLHYFYNQLMVLGVKALPVVGYDRWEDESYRIAMKGLRDVAGSIFCLRLDINAIEDFDESDFFLGNIQSIVDGLGLVPSQSLVLIDHGDVAQINVEDIVFVTKGMIRLLKTVGFEKFAMSGCSLPPSVDQAVAMVDSEGVVIRKEMLAWKNVYKASLCSVLLYSDYCVRGPKSNNGIQNPHINGKIRYTTKDQFFVVRGHSMQYPGKGEQMYGLAKKVINSNHYMGGSFSWGDSRIEDCSLQKFKGNACNWIAIDTNHHIGFVLSEVAEFVSRVRQGLV